MRALCSKEWLPHDPLAMSVNNADVQKKLDQVRDYTSVKRHKERVGVR